MTDAAMTEGLNPLQQQAMAEKIADLKRQIEAERSARVWHTQDSVDSSKLLAAREMDLSEQETLIRQKLGRARKISLNRLRRAKAAEAELAQMRAQRNGALQRLDMAEAELRSEKRTVAELREALMRAVEAKETYAASWRIQAEEWEAKYKDAIETEGKKWEHAVTTWQTRYEDALKRIDRLKAEARGAGASDD